MMAWVAIGIAIASIIINIANVRRYRDIEERLDRLYP